MYVSKPPAAEERKRGMEVRLVLAFGERGAMIFAAMCHHFRIVRKVVLVVCCVTDFTRYTSSTSPRTKCNSLYLCCNDSKNKEIGDSRKRLTLCVAHNLLNGRWGYTGAVYR